MPSPHRGEHHDQGRPDWTHGGHSNTTIHHGFAGHRNNNGTHYAPPPPIHHMPQHGEEHNPNGADHRRPEHHEPEHHEPKYHEPEHHKPQHHKPQHHENVTYHVPTPVKRYGKARLDIHPR